MVFFLFFLTIEFSFFLLAFHLIVSVISPYLLRLKIQRLFTSASTIQDTFIEFLSILSTVFVLPEFATKETPACIRSIGKKKRDSDELRHVVTHSIQYSSTRIQRPTSVLRMFVFDATVAICKNACSELNKAAFAMDSTNLAENKSGKHVNRAKNARKEVEMHKHKLVWDKNHEKITRILNVLDFPVWKSMVTLFLENPGNNALQMSFVQLIYAALSVQHESTLSTVLKSCKLLKKIADTFEYFEKDQSDSGSTQLVSTPTSTQSRDASCSHEQKSSISLRGPALLLLHLLRLYTNSFSSNHPIALYLSSNIKWQEIESMLTHNALERFFYLTNRLPVPIKPVFPIQGDAVDGKASDREEDITKMNEQVTEILPEWQRLIDPSQNGRNCALLLSKQLGSRTSRWYLQLFGISLGIDFGATYHTIQRIQDYSEAASHSIEALVELFEEEKVQEQTQKRKKNRKKSKKVDSSFSSDSDGSLSIDSSENQIEPLHFPNGDKSSNSLCEIDLKTEADIEDDAALSSTPNSKKKRNKKNRKHKSTPTQETKA